jgi:HEAT repeat protein
MVNNNLSCPRTRIQSCAKPITWFLFLLALCWTSDTAGAESESVDRLISALKDKDETTRARAADALRALGKDAAPAVPALTEALKDGSAIVRKAAIEALGSIGPKAQAAIPALMNALEDPDEEVRGYVPLALADICGEKIQALTDALGKDSPYLRRLGAITALGIIGPKASAAVPQIATAFREPDKEIRMRAIKALGDIEDEKAIPFLVDVLRKDPDLDCRIKVAGYLSVFRQKAKPAIPALIEAMKTDGDQYLGLQIAACGTLITIGSDSVPAVSAVLRDRSQPTIVRRDATYVLGSMGTKALDSIPDLVNALKDDDEKLRGAAAFALGEMGPKAKAALDPLEQFAKCGTASDCVAAAGALYKIDPSNADSVRLLKSALKVEIVSIRLEAVNDLRRMGPKAAPAVPELCALLKEDKDADVRAVVARALELIGPSARAAVPVLKYALKNDTPDGT